MPELPEIETVKRGLAPLVVGLTISKVVVRNDQLRWRVPGEIKQLSNKKILGIKRRAKYLLFELDKGAVIMHLGMSGSVRVLNAEHPPGKHDHVDFVFGDGVVMRYTDPRRFGCILYSEDSLGNHDLLKHIGPEPLSAEFDDKYLYRRCKKRKIYIKQLIMDASEVAGVGNIYANEALYISGIRPRRRAASITKVESERLVRSIKEVLKKAIKQGGTTLKDFTAVDGQPGYFTQSLKIYDREGERCERCQSMIKKISIAKRATYYCANCQA